MERDSQPTIALASQPALEGQLRECYGRVVYAHKTHEKCADLLLSRLASIKLWQIILSAIATSGFIAALLGSGQIGALAGLIVSTVLLVLSAYTKNYDLGELAEKHRQAAAELWMLREQYLSLITDLRTGEKAIATIMEQRDEMLKALQSVYSGAPSTNCKAYRQAQHALKHSEDMTFSDAEIDAFLPKELRRTESGQGQAALGTASEDSR